MIETILGASFLTLILAFAVGFGYVIWMEFLDPYARRK